MFNEYQSVVPLAKLYIPQNLSNISKNSRKWNFQNSFKSTFKCYFRTSYHFQIFVISRHDLLSHASVEVETKLHPGASIAPEVLFCGCFVLWMFWDRISASGTQPSWLQPPKYLCSACSRVLSSGLGTSLSVSSETEAVYCLWMDSRTGKMPDATFIFELIPQGSGKLSETNGAPAVPHLRCSWGILRGNHPSLHTSRIWCSLLKASKHPLFPQGSSASSKDVSAPSTSCPNLQWGGACVHDGQERCPLWYQLLPQHLQDGI